MGIDALGEYAARLIRFKSQQLIGKHGFTRSDREDIEQELRADLIGRLRRFDPARAQRNTFIARVIDHKVATIIEQRHAAMRDVAREERSLNARDNADGETREPFGDTLAEDEVLARHGRARRSSEELRDLALDLRYAMDGLTDHDRKLCLLLLETGTVSEASRRSGIPRSMIYEVRERIRQRFEQAGLQDYLPKKCTFRRQFPDGSGK
jgi:RNA polymerase sigma-70 factor, ECF subfamily